MSRILQLQISGIRAFDNHDTQKLTFNSPLTLICGQNGVGKTTVIESLRYVTTGDLPPNVKGGAFVHDPRMSSESEVLAQVRLLFQNVSGVEMVATRSMKLSVSKGNKMTFKTLEGFVKEQKDNSNSKTSVSARTSDLNLQVPLLLGVPPAILNYVVFCHQEDSLWPFSEPSAVKKKFDDIFEATKYTKALDSLKALKKDYTTNIRVESKDVEHLEEDKQRVSEKENQLASILESIDQLKAETEQLQSNRQAKSHELNKAVEHNQKMQQMENAKSNILSQIARYNQDIEQLQSELDMVSDKRTEEIEKELEDSNDRYQALNAEMDTKNKKLNTLKESMVPLNQDLAAINNQQGRIEQMLEAQQKRLAKRNEITKNAEPDSWKSENESILEKLGLELDSLEASNRKEQMDLNREVSSSEALQLQLIQTVNSARESILALDKEGSDVRSQLNLLEKENNLENFKDRLLDMQNRVQDLELESQNTASEYSKFVDSGVYNESLQKLKEKEQLVEEKRKQLTRVIDNSKRLSQLHHYKARLAEIEQKLATANDELGGMELATTKLNKLKLDFEQAQSKVNKMEAQLQMENKNYTTALSRKSNLDSRVDNILKVNGLSENTISEFDQQLKNAENAVLEATEEQEQLSFAHKYYERALARAEEEHKPSCLLCEHEKDPEEAKMLVKLLKSKIESLEITPEEAQKVTEQRKETLKKLKSLQPKVQELRQLYLEQETLSTELKKQKDALDDLEGQVKNTLNNKLEAERSLKQLRDDVEPMISTVKRYEAEKSEMSSKISLEEKIMGSTNTDITLSEAQSQQEQCERDLKLERTNVECVRNEGERLKSRSEAAAQTVKDLKLAISELELTSSRVQQLTDKLQQFRKDQDQQQKVQKEAEEKLPGIAIEIEAKRKELSQRKFSDSKNEKALAEKRNDQFQLLRQFKELSNEITEFTRSHGEDPLSKLAQNRLKAQAKINDLNTQIENSEKGIKEAEKIIADFASFRRGLQDNIKLRRYQEQLEKYNAKLADIDASLKREVEEFGSSPDELEDKMRKLQEELGGINHLISKMSGELKALQEQIQVIRNELSTTYKDTANKYELAVARLNSSKGAAHDLQQYSVALDRAIMKYHHMKMDEINELLDQMWKQTYTGTDIDSIMIRSEPGEGASRTSHNYRVCMIKQDTLLDMRGRCSAGQKVLASILIRMALAECFGNSSGLIVLDEPTTNLDYENIEGLARSLGEIIAMRSVQPNFQLIVITHDEHFLTQMNPSSHCNSFYKICRDERQLSTITKLPITSLQ